MARRPLSAPEPSICTAKAIGIQEKVICAQAAMNQSPSVLRTRQAS
jgi:hypothetical protein